MTGAEGSGPGRRLTEVEEQRGAELFAEGLSTRAVARALDVGNGTAARLRQRLAAGHATSGTEEATVHDGHQAAPAREPDLAGTTVTLVPVHDFDSQLAGLQQQRETQAGIAAELGEREAVSRQAAAELAAEHEAGLAAIPVRSDPGLRERRRNAEDDAADWAKAAGHARDRLAAIDGEIQAVQARIADARDRTELAEAITQRDAVCARTGDRMRAAALAHQGAAQEFADALLEDAAAIRKVGELATRIALTGPAPLVPPAVSTALSVDPAMTNAGAPLAMQRAINEARAGNVRAVSTRLAEVFGQIPPTPAYLAAEAERRRAAIAAWQAQADAGAAEQATAPAPAQPLADVPAWSEGEFGLDADGNPLRPRPAYQDQPGDSWRTPGVGGRVPLVPPDIPGAGWLR